MFLEQGADVHLKTEGECVEHAIYAAAVSRTQIERTRQVVVESEVDAVVSGQAYASVRRAWRTLATTEEDLLRSPRKYVVPGSSDAEFVAEIKFGASLKVRDITVGDVRAMQESRIGNRVAKTEIDKGRERIKSVCKMIAPVNRHVTGAQPFRGACRGDCDVQARAQVKSRLFCGIPETQIPIPHAARGSRACLRSGRLDEEVQYTHAHGKVLAKGVANGRVYVSDKPIRVAAALIGLCPREPLLLDAAFSCPLRHGLRHG